MGAKKRTTRGRAKNLGNCRQQQLLCYFIIIGDKLKQYLYSIRKQKYQLGELL